MFSADGASGITSRVNPEHAPKFNAGPSLTQKKSMLQAYETVKKAISNAQKVLNAALKRQARFFEFAENYQQTGGDFSF